MKTLFKAILWLVIIALLCYGGYAAYGKVLRYIYPTDYYEQVDKYADECSLDRSLVYAVIKCESGYDSEAVSSVGAIGLMQLTPETFEWISSKYDKGNSYTSDDLYTPQINIKAGCYLLKYHLDEFSDVKTAVAAYHAGRGKVNEWLSNSEYSADGKKLDKIPYADTSSYVEKIIKTKEKYQNIYDMN